MSQLPQLGKGDINQVETLAADDKNVDDIYSDEKNVDEAYPDEKTAKDPGQWTPPQEWYERIKDEYSGQHEGEALPPGCDPDRFALAIFTMSPEQSVECLVAILENLDNDYTFDRVQAARMVELVAGNEACGLEYSEWAYQVTKTAGIIHNWSAYLEVRSCTLPYDDPEEPCESSGLSS